MSECLWPIWSIISSSSLHFLFIILIWECLCFYVSCCFILGPVIFPKELTSIFVAQVVGKLGIENDHQNSLLSSALLAYTHAHTLVLCPRAAFLTLLSSPAWGAALGAVHCGNPGRVRRRRLRRPGEARGGRDRGESSAVVTVEESTAP